MIPPILKTGDKICLVATARKVSLEEIVFSVKILESWGLQVIYAKNLFAVENQFAGTELQRAEDLQNAIVDQEIKAILCVRGGYGTTRMLDLVDFSPLVLNPKWIIGFSDVTAIHCHLEKMGLMGVHGIMPLLFAKPNAEKSVLALKNLLFEGEIHYQLDSNPNNKTGKASGILVGGNLSIIAHLMGTQTEIETDGKILFLEDLDEYLYHIDRMFVQLKRANKFLGLKGLIIGHFSDLKDNAVPFGKNIEEIVLDAVKGYDFPVCFDFPTGHDFDNLPLICGKNALLDVQLDVVRFEQL